MEKKRYYIITTYFYELTTLSNLEVFVSRMNSEIVFGDPACIVNHITNKQLHFLRVVRFNQYLNLSGKEIVTVLSRARVLPIRTIFKV